MFANHKEIRIPLVLKEKSLVMPQWSIFSHVMIQLYYQGAS